MVSNGAIGISGIAVGTEKISPIVVGTASIAVAPSEVSVRSAVLAAGSMEYRQAKGWHMAAARPADASGTYARGQVKWHPGHYVTLLPGLAPSAEHIASVILETVANPALRGVQVRYTWAELEPTNGTFDFSRIQRDLDLVQASGKRLFILLQTKQFSDEFPAIPSYLDTVINGGGAFTISSASQAASDAVSPGRNIKLWNATVRDRLSALVTALGASFNQHPMLEGVALSETAMGTPVDIIVTARQTQAFYDNLLVVNAAMRTAFPNTVTLQFTNYPKPILPEFVTGLKRRGSGLGGPDIYLDDADLLTGIYPHYALQAGQIPLAPSVQGENYKRRGYDGPDNPPSIDELYRFGRDDLHANYMFWTRRAFPQDNPYADVLTYMSSPGFPSGLAGGLATNCPRVYVQCID